MHAFTVFGLGGERGESAGGGGGGGGGRGRFCCVGELLVSVSADEGSNP